MKNKPPKDTDSDFDIRYRLETSYIFLLLGTGFFLAIFMILVVLFPVKKRFETYGVGLGRRRNNSLLCKSTEKNREKE